MQYHQHISIILTHRLIQLGFPQGEEAARKGALNLGLKDQLVALEWIQLNIAAFGGDKRKVTVAGERYASLPSLNFEMLISFQCWRVLC